MEERNQETQYTVLQFLERLRPLIIRYRNDYPTSVWEYGFVGGSSNPKSISSILQTVQTLQDLIQNINPANPPVVQGHYTGDMIRWRITDILMRTYRAVIYLRDSIESHFQVDPNDPKLVLLLQIMNLCKEGIERFITTSPNPPTYIHILTKITEPILNPNVIKSVSTIIGQLSN